MTLIEKAGDTMSETTDSNRSTRWWLRRDSCSVVIEAPAERLYGMVADMPRMGEWSPECQQVEWLEGSNGPAQGARFVGHNRTGPRGLIKWSRRGPCTHRRSGPRVRLCDRRGRLGGGRVAVSLRARRAGHTRATESYTITRIPTWARILDIPTNRVRELRDGMQHTLEQLKRSAETSSQAS